MDAILSYYPPEVSSWPSGHNLQQLQLGAHVKSGLKLKDFNWHMHNKSALHDSDWHSKIQSNNPHFNNLLLFIHGLTLPDLVFTSRRYTG